MTDGWLQADLALAAHGEGRAAHAHAFFGDLLPTVAGLTEAGFTTGTWFLRKPPDVRVRIGVTGHDDDHVRAAIGEVVDQARGDGHLTEAGWSDYLPETERFGGPTAMAVAHAHFCRDTEAWHRAAARARALHASPDAVAADLACTLDARCRAFVAAAERTGAVGAVATWHDLAALAGGADDGVSFLALVLQFDCNRWGVGGPGQLAMARRALIDLGVDPEGDP